MITGIPLPQAYPQAINNNGDVLLWATDVKARAHHSYLWSGGKVTDLGDLGGVSKKTGRLDPSPVLAGAIGYGLNDKRQVVGRSRARDGNNHAFLWDQGKMRDLGTLGGKNSEAWDVNNLGQVVGRSDTANGEQHAFIWERNSGMRDLGVPGKTSMAQRINDKGQALGLCLPSWTTFVWQKRKISYPEKQPLKDFRSFQGLNMNNRGDIIGVVDRGGTEGTHESRIFLYSEGRMAPVETPAKKESNAFGLTSDGLVVGNAFDTPTGQHAFVWRNGTAALLNDLVLPPGWDIYFALTVNDSGRIAAAGKRLSGKGRGGPVVLIPVASVPRFIRKEDLEVVLNTIAPDEFALYQRLSSKAYDVDAARSALLLVRKTYQTWTNVRDTQAGQDISAELRSGVETAHMFAWECAIQCFRKGKDSKARALILDEWGASLLRGQGIRWMANALYDEWDRALMTDSHFVAAFERTTDPMAIHGFCQVFGRYGEQAEEDLLARKLDSTKLAMNADSIEFKVNASNIRAAMQLIEGWKHGDTERAGPKISPELSISNYRLPTRKE